jgi:hypothetical protein
MDVKCQMSIVFNTSFPSSVLKNKHNEIAYNRVREAIAAKIMKFACIKSEENEADILTKSLSNEKFHYFVKSDCFVFRLIKIEMITIKDI